MSSLTLPSPISAFDASVRGAAEGFGREVFFRPARGVEASTAAGHDRPDRLHEHADGAALVEEIAGRIDQVDRERASNRWAPDRDGDTTYLCTAGRSADGRMMGVSLIQSNASGLGSHLVEPNTGINLHNRGMGFNLHPGHPAELGPGRCPPHTLSAALATRDGELLSVFGTMGGDALSNHSPQP